MLDEITLFLDFLSLERNLKTNTLVSYENDIKALAAFAAEAGAKSWSEVDRHLLIEFTAESNKQGMAPSSGSALAAASQSAQGKVAFKSRITTRGDDWRR